MRDSFQLIGDAMDSFTLWNMDIPMPDKYAECVSAVKQIYPNHNVIPFDAKKYPGLTPRRASDIERFKIMSESKTELLYLDCDVSPTGLFSGSDFDLFFENGQWLDIAAMYRSATSDGAIFRYLYDSVLSGYLRTKQDVIAGGYEWFHDIINKPDFFAHKIGAEYFNHGAFSSR